MSLLTSLLLALFSVQPCNLSQKKHSSFLLLLGSCCALNRVKPVHVEVQVDAGGMMGRSAGLDLLGKGSGPSSDLPALELTV